MEGAPDLLHLLVRALVLVAQALDQWFHIPWPLPFTVLFLPILAGLDVAVWYLRGMFFPIRCSYPTVKPRLGTCTRKVLGEWHRCLKDHTKRKLRLTDNHVIDRKLRRWQTVRSGLVIENTEIQGRGFLRMRSHSDTLLYRQGFARRPEDVLSKTNGMFQDYKDSARKRWSRLRQGFAAAVGRKKQLVETSDVLPSVIRATRLNLTFIALGLGLVAISLLTPTWASVILEYCATYSFIIALAVLRTGIWRAQKSWARDSTLDATKWIFWLTLLAALSGLIGLYEHDFVDALKAVVEILFSGFSLLVVGCLFYVLNPKERKRSARRRGRK